MVLKIIALIYGLVSVAVLACLLYMAGDVREEVENEMPEVHLLPAWNFALILAGCLIVASATWPVPIVKTVIKMMRGK